VEGLFRPSTEKFEEEPLQVFEGLELSVDQISGK
jgi:hypothetical protein